MQAACCIVRHLAGLFILTIRARQAIQGAADIRHGEKTHPCPASRIHIALQAGLQTNASVACSPVAVQSAPCSPHCSENKGSADLFDERDEVQGARRAELCMAIPPGGKPPSGWSALHGHSTRRQAAKWLVSLAWPFH
jgi:hypothetical protein